MRNSKSRRKANCILLDIEYRDENSSVSVTDPPGCSPGHTHRDLPALLPGVLPADLLRDLVAHLVVLGDLVALLVGSVVVVDVVVSEVVVGDGLDVGDTLLPVVHHLLTVLPG